MELFLRMIASIWRPHAGQEEFLCNEAKIRVLACGRRWGKTDACAVSILAELFREKPSRHLIIAPTQDQAKLLFDRVVSLLQEILGESRSEDFKVRRTPFPNLSFGNHTVTARSGHIGRSLRGNEATHIVVDEAAYVPEELVTEVAMPMLATNHGRLTLISTPNGLNHFWRFFRMGEEGQNGVWSRTAPSSESPFVSAGFLDVQRQLISQRAYEIEYEAQFVDPAGTVFPGEEIEACLAPSVEINDDPIVIGVDWARYSDFSAVSVLQGFRQDCQLLELRQFNGLNWKDQVAEVGEVAARYPKARIVGDGTGIGDVIMEMLADAVGAHRVQ